MTISEGLTVAELAALVDGNVVGDADTRIRGVATLIDAGPDELGFYVNRRYRAQLQTTGAGAVLLEEAHVADCPVTAVVVENPHYAYSILAERLYPRARADAGIHQTAVIEDGAVLGEGVTVGPNAVIRSGASIGRNCEIGAGVYIGRSAEVGADSRLEPGAYVANGCSLGERVVLAPGVVIGADGFGLARGEAGWRSVPQLGAVRIGNRVEIGANSTVDRGALEDTVIEDGVKLDNLVHIGHNCHVGANTVIAGGTVLAGSVTVGRDCTIGGQSALTSHIHIADGVTIMGMTGVSGTLDEPGVYASPIPAHPLKAWRRNAVRFTQLDAMHRRLQRLERTLEQAE